jgi:hypothetical protein
MTWMFSLGGVHLNNITGRPASGGSPLSPLTTPFSVRQGWNPTAAKPVPLWLGGPPMANGQRPLSIAYENVDETIPFAVVGRDADEVGQALQALKLALAGMLLKPFALFQWLNWPIAIGLLSGILLLPLLLRLRRRWRALLTVQALCFNLIVDALWPLRETPLSALKLFRWSGQQLLNFNGMAHTIADIWPFLALLFLLRYFQLERARQGKTWL